jgi:glycosyltransferase involved in cell wall biosynthesis
LADGIHYLKQENRGAAAARNTGLRAAAGEFVAFLDADDKWSPNFLEEQIKLLERSNADLVFSDAVFFGESPLAGRTFMELQPSRGEVTPEKLLAVEVTILTSTVVVRKAAVIAVGLFDESIRRGHDFDLWLRLAKHGMRFAYQREILAYYRILESGLSGGTISQLQRTLAVLEILKAKTGWTPSEQAALQLNMKRTLRQLALEKGKEKLIDKDFAGALDAVNEAKKFHQDWKLRCVSLGLRIAPGLIWRIYNRRSVRLSGQLAAK